MVLQASQNSSAIISSSSSFVCVCVRVCVPACVCEVADLSNFVSVTNSGRLLIWNSFQEKITFSCTIIGQLD